MSDLISRQAAIDALVEEGRNVDSRYLESERIIHESDAIEAIAMLPSAQPEQSTGVQDILRYLDEYLHPIVSPEHWSVYSELHDMVSKLPSADPEIIRCDEILNMLGENMKSDVPEKNADDVLCHCNVKENAELIARILDCDVDGELYKADVPKRKVGKWIIHDQYKQTKEDTYKCDTCRYETFDDCEEPCIECSNFNKWKPMDKPEVDKHCYSCKHEATLLGEYPCSVCLKRTKWESKED